MAKCFETSGGELGILELLAFLTVGAEISNGEALDFGWRVREMRLYNTEDCAATSEVRPRPTFDGANFVISASQRSNFSGSGR